MRQLDDRSNARPTPHTASADNEIPVRELSWEYPLRNDEPEKRPKPARSARSERRWESWRWSFD